MFKNDYNFFMKKLFLLTMILMLGNPGLALDVVYPKSTRVTINANSTFFIGSTKPNSWLKVNGQNVKLHKSGAFAYVINLKDWQNTFVVESGADKKTYIINKPIVQSVSKSNYNSPQFVQYKYLKNYLVADDNVPLRETPVDSGINRMSHFQKEIPLIVDGENKNFYRVVLNDNARAWISKGDVTLVTDDFVNNPAEIKNYEHKESRDYDTFVFDLDKKTPYIITEGNPFKLTFYNVRNNPDSTYTFEFPLSHKLFGYSGYFDGNKFILKIRKPPKNIKALKIAIDPGHGGNEWGAISCFCDKEKDLNLAISKYLQEELKARGADVVMTRKSDIDVGLRDRVNFANKEDAAILISIHGNALPDCLDPNKHRGTSIYYYYNQSKPLADNILKYMTVTAGTQNDQVRQGSLALVRNTNALSILIEVAYLINPDDSVLLKDDNFQRKCARAIADGIESFLHN